MGSAFLIYVLKLWAKRPRFSYSLNHIIIPKVAIDHGMPHFAIFEGKFNGVIHPADHLGPHLIDLFDG
ncbi:hypothetical protein N779_12835 [Vibrio coralliilyticus OCN008]|nr:hypothetical protein N779_12835 [Vibrio coralliilyticus OCN008]